MTNCRLLLARNMKRYRKLLGITQSGLAEKINCSTTLIGNIEICKRFPSADNLDLIANALGIRVADLFSEVESETIKAMASKQEMKARLGKLVNEVVDDLFCGDVE